MGELKVIEATQVTLVVPEMLDLLEMLV